MVGVAWIEVLEALKGQQNEQMFYEEDLGCIDQETL